MDLNYKFENVSIKDIDISSTGFDRFLFSYNRDFKQIKNSINRIGLINPVILQKQQYKDKHNHIVVCGYQRVKACIELRNDVIKAKVIDSACNEKLLLTCFHDNIFTREFNDIEKALIVKKFLSIGYSFNKLTTEITNNIGMPPNKKIHDKYLALLDFEKEIKDAIANNEIEMEKALQLLEFDHTDRAFIYDLLFKEVNINLNETKDIIQSLTDLKHMKQTEITEIMTSNEITKIISDKSLDKRKKGEQICGVIKRMRYPLLSEQEFLFEKLCKSLNLNSNIRINHSRYFEQNDIQITIKSSDEKKLNADFEKLLANMKNGNFKEIFSVSRCSNTIKGIKH